MAAKLPEASSKVVDDELTLDGGDQYADIDKLEIPAESETPNQDAARQALDDRKASQTPDEDEQVDDEDDGEDPFQGKTEAERRRMYRDAQRQIGEQGREIGSLRDRFDQFMAEQLKQAQANRAPAQPREPRKPLEDADFFAAPGKALERGVAEHPEVQRLRAEHARTQAQIEGFRRQQAQAAFERAHPDFAEVVQNPEFQKWVGASQIRTKMLRSANANYDFVAGHELFSTWKELQAARQPAKEDAAKAAAAKREAGRKGAKVPTGGNAAPAAASSAKPIYRRSQILKLMETDRERYEQMAPEIERAYAEGRVR